MTDEPENEEETDDVNPEDEAARDEEVALREAKTAVEHRRALEEEYGRWTANRRIFHDGALAYDTGHPVPHANVILHGYHMGDDPVVDRVNKEG